ncbi:MAG: hypothetical protein ABMA64_14385 [Myxococcota bacterium]
MLDLIKMLMISGPPSSGPVGALASFLYEPHAKLPGYVAKLRQFADGKLTLTAKEQGDLLEQVAALCFRGLRDAPLPLSIAVPDAQLDVLQMGDTRAGWMGLAWLLGFPPGRRNIVAECKCYGPTARSVAKGRPKGDGVPQREYARLGGLMQTSLSDAVGLGVMFSLWGGTGAGPQAPSESRLFRIKYHARHDVPIVDVTLKDVEEHCLTNGGFVELLFAKISELTVLSTMELIDPGKTPTIERTLPKHLAEVLL